MNTDIYTLISLFLTLTVAITFANHKLFKLPTSIGVMSGSLIIALAVIITRNLGFDAIAIYANRIMAQVDFHNLLMKWLLSFLLFAGSLTIDFNQLKSHAKLISIVTLFGVIVSTAILGYSTHLLLSALGTPLPLIYCLLFGALISPTDPIAVLATFKKYKANKNIRIIIAGESLFNDGVGIVVFFTLFQLTFNAIPISALSIGKLFCQQTLGGVAYGIAIGLIAQKIINESKDHLIAILVTLTITTAGYSLAMRLGISGPLAMVVSGIFLSNYAKKGTQEAEVNRMLNTFWEIIDEVLNTVLFLLLGLELITLQLTWNDALASIIAIPAALCSRYISIATPLAFLKYSNVEQKDLRRILTWGGLRGGLAVALALSLPETTSTAAFRNIIICMTFSIVTFSIIVQGSTIGRLIPKKH